MHSPVGWVCFGVLLVFAISANAGVLPSGSYQIIHGPSFGNPVPYYQRIVPTYAYRSNAPQIFARRVEARQAEEEDEEPTDNGEDEGAEGEGEEIYEQESGGIYTNSAEQIRSDEEQDEEEENEQEEDNGEFDHGEVMRNENEDQEEDEEYNTRLYGVNHQKYRHNLNATSLPKKTPPKTRNSLKKNSSKIGQSNNKHYNAKKRKISHSSDAIPSARSTLGSSILAQESNENDKPQLKPKITSRTQFITTPIADLILRLSISLAKPVGHDNGTATFFNVPIRVSHAEGEKVNSSSALNLALDAASKSKLEVELPKIDSIVANSDSVKDLPAPIPIQIKTEVRETQKKENDDVVLGSS